MSMWQRQAIKSLQTDKNIIFLQLNQENTSVIIDNVEYPDKLADLIGNNK